MNSFQIVLLDKLPEVSVDHIFMDGEPILTQVWNLEEHGSSHVNTVQKFKIDVKVVWNVSLFLLDLFLKSLFLLSGVVADSLSQTFFQFWTLADVNKNGVAFFKHTKSECSEANLNNGPVELNLDSDCLLGHNMGDSCFHEKVFGLIVPVMDSMVINLLKSGLNFHFLLAVLDDRLNNIINHLLTRLLMEIYLLQFVSFALQCLLSLGVDLIVLVVDMIKLDQTNSCNLYRVRELSEVSHELITQLNQQALIS